MDNALYAALSGQTALRRKMDSVANNMANLSTIGFKAENTHFNSVFERLESDGKGVDFVFDVSSTTDFAQGPLRQTNNQLDVAISGNGMLAIQGTNGENFYTRDGRMSRNSEGALVMTATGKPVLDNAGVVIEIPEGVTQLSIANDGTITATVEGDDQQIATIGVYNFEPSNMKRHDSGLYSMTVPAEVTLEAKLHQGFIEGSNVNAVQTLTDMIQVQRAYEAGKNIMESEDQRIRGAISRMGQVVR